MAYTTIDNPELYFQVKTYAGNGGSQSITFDGSEDMSANLAWLKSRTNTEPHMIIDSVRGVTNRLRVNLNSAEDTTDVLTSFDSDGLTFGSGSDGNSTSQNYVAWCWKESADAGFDIVSYTGNGSARTISHSLSAVPNVIIVKKRSDSGDWKSQWSVLGNGKSMRLDSTEAAATASTYWNDTSPTSSVFSVGTDSDINGSSETTIAYLWSEKQGFSKFGSYTSNNSSDGVFVHLGFKPSFVMVKGSSAAGLNWVIHDNKRHSVTPASGGTNFNVINRQLMPNLTNADDTNDGIDFLSNGFKWRWNGGDVNGTAGRTYVYMAFAEAPFVNSKGVPCNAR